MNIVHVLNLLHKYKGLKEMKFWSPKRPKGCFDSASTGGVCFKSTDERKYFFSKKETPHKDQLVAA